MTSQVISNDKINGLPGARQPAGWEQEDIYTSNGIILSIADLIDGDYTSRLKWDKIPYADFYNGFWHYPGEKNKNLVVKGGSGLGTHIANDIGIDVFLGHADLAVFQEDTVDNFMEIKNFEPSNDLLIIPFSSTDNINIILENNSVFALLENKKKDKIYQLSATPNESNTGFADQLNTVTGTFSGQFRFHSGEETDHDLSHNDGPKEQDFITPPEKFKRKFVDKIINFNPSTDTLEINTESFGIDTSATFASGKNKKTVKKKLAKQDSDFLYDQKKGGLYFNENGANKGFGEGGIIAILKGSPDLTANDFKFI